MKVNALADLSLIKKEIAAQTARKAAQAAERALQAKRRAAARNLFQTAVGKVEPLAPTHQVQRAALGKTPPEPIARQQMLDDAAALQEALSDEVDISSLLETDAQLSFRRRGVGQDVTERLRKGHWSMQRQVDLHGLRTDEARLALTEFIREAHRHGVRCIRVVHGKGLGSPGKTPVLKDKVHRWLVQKEEVIAFVQAPPSQGGAGALLVLLQPVGK
jgi:DNA-nicking Smr family endonuclease